MWRSLEKFKMAITLPYSIDITGSAARGVLIVEDLNKFDEKSPNNNKIIIDLDSNKRAIVDLANLRSGYDNGDKLEIRLVGTRTGNVVHTVDTTKGNLKTTISQSGADYAGASINL